jgi:serine/threonine protein kinase
MVRVIDFGSAHLFNESGAVHITTPEYMPPEALSPHAILADLAQTSHPHSWDMWSLGVIVVEIAMGFPIWFSLKARNEHGGFSLGFFGVSGRDPVKILVK